MRYCSFFCVLFLIQGGGVVKVLLFKNQDKVTVGVYASFTIAQSVNIIGPTFDLLLKYKTHGCTLITISSY